MRSSKDIERALKHADLDVEINAETDRAIMGELEEAHLRAAPWDPGRAWLGYAALAAAAVLTLTVYVWNHREAPRSPDAPPPAVATSAAEMLTVGQLKAAYRRGGLEAFEAQCDEAAEKMDVAPTALSLRDLIVELEGP